MIGTERFLAPLGMTKSGGWARATVGMTVPEFGGSADASLEPNSIVIVSLHTPKEKVWGSIVSMNPAGVTLRGIDLNSFDDFIRQVMDPEGERVGLPTLFFPMQRVERIALDEPHGSIPSLSGRFEQRVGRSLRGYLALFV